MPILVGRVGTWECEDTMSLESSIHIGLEMQRPEPGPLLAGLYFFARDTQELSLCDGTEWTLVPLTVVFGPSGANHSLGMVPDAGAVAGTGKYLREDATWVVPPSGSGSGLSVLLNYVPDADMSAVAVGANVWHDYFTEQNFTTAAANQPVIVFLGGMAQQTSTTVNVVNRILIDGVQAGPTIGGAPSHSNLLGGCTPVPAVVPIAGVHTVKAQLISLDRAMTVYCRQHTYPLYENFSLVVLG